MASLLKSLRKVIRQAPELPLRFPAAGFEVFSDSIIVEEEQFDAFKTGQYYPVKIGDVYHRKYQVLGKLGFGTTSTVWLARNLIERKHVALKIYTRDANDGDELRIYETLANAGRSHPGYRHVRTALDTFRLDMPGGATHACLVQTPMWDSFRDLASRNPTGRFTEHLLKAALVQLFLALDFLHSECRLIHTDIKADNILQELVDTSVIDAFTQAEIDHPSPRKVVNGATIFASRGFERPKKFGDVVLSDFGSAVKGDQKRNHDAQPDVYRSPEVMLETEWSYPIDIWNVGVMIWDLFEGRHLFYGHDPERDRYLTRAHLAEVIALLGPPPLDLVQRGQRGREFFTEDGKWNTGISIPKRKLEDTVTVLEGEKKEAFLKFVRGMLQWRPEDRKTAAQLVDDPWLRS
ncbi:CMGC protein kinase [Trichocladium antarcticum]|uniref:non-specific serine/threonine protein kinase n=1 Tax=Trichocladium antarcticum TaxID=1450529 RepID=A0AAN6UJE0_9PEZI|nr:CMGC protein kinase [Trichocladium antarcticum]